MGFLDHTTNNIVIDAVLTERGRELLARNDGSFRIDAFAFGDDEVDYSNIVKYGISIGKEKIEKNTPIFEAQTNENHALKYNNITLSNSTTRILYIPIITPYEGISVSNNIISPVELAVNTSNATVRNKTISVLSTIPSIAGQDSIDSNLADLRFEVKMNSLLLSLYSSNNTPVSNYIDLDENLVSTYRVTTSNTDVSSATSLTAPNDYALKNRQLLSLNVGIANNINKTTFQKFGQLITNGQTVTGTIDTFVEIIGLGSGSRLLVPVKIRLS